MPHKKLRSRLTPKSNPPSTPTSSPDELEIELSPSVKRDILFVRGKPKINYRTFDRPERVRLIWVKRKGKNKYNIDPDDILRIAHTLQKLGMDLPSSLKHEISALNMPELERALRELGFELPPSKRRFRPRALIEPTRRPRTPPKQSSPQSSTGTKQASPLPSDEKNNTKKPKD